MGAGRAANAGELSGERAGQAVHVLLFEDNASDAQYLQQLLAQSNLDFRVTWSARLDAVLQILRGSTPVDVILADRTLLDVNTFWQLQSEKADAPVLLLAKEGDSVASSLLREGAQDYLTKWNFDSRGLERAIQCAILRKDAENRLKEQERRYVLALQAAREGVWDWDLRNNRVVFSNGCREILGWDEAMLDRVVAAWPSMVHPDDVKALRYAFVLHLRGRSEHLTVEFRSHCKDGSYRWIEARGAALRGSDGQPYRLTGSFTDITGRKNNEQQLTYTAFHDPLTRLANRNLFLDRLTQVMAQAERRGGFYAVLFLDLDGFKRVNDSFGHGVGDHLLIAVARRLQTLLRPGDTLARFGGDEFAIILGNCKSLPDVCRVADRLLERLGFPFRINGNDVLTSASVGVAAGSHPYQKPEEILSDADIAMYRAKARGKACYEIYRHEGQPGAEVHLSDLQLALDRDQFLVYFQPVVDINTGQLHSLEALIRWCHPARGLLAPTDFYNLFESTDLVHRIENWVLRQACSQVVRWRKFSPEVAVSVNLSARHLQAPEFVAGVQEIVADVGASPASLILEVTEEALKNDPGGIGKKLKRLRDSGIRVLVDELGSGQSSLSGLQSLPCESVKIDRSVVAGVLCDIDSGKILRAIVALARSLRMRVVAAGVESEKQLKEVRRIGCDLAQGLWFSAPLKSDAALALVRSRSRIGWLRQPPAPQP